MDYIQKELKIGQDFIDLNYSIDRENIPYHLLLSDKEIEEQTEDFNFTESSPVLAKIDSKYIQYYKNIKNLNHLKLYLIEDDNKNKTHTLK